MKMTTRLPLGNNWAGNITFPSQRPATKKDIEIIHIMLNDPTLTREEATALYDMQNKLNLWEDNDGN